MDPVTRYLAERVLADVSFLNEQGHLTASQLQTFRTSLSPLLDGGARATTSSTPTPAAPQATDLLGSLRQHAQPGQAAKLSGHLSSASKYVSAAKNKVPPPPPPPASTVAAPPSPRKDLVKALWAFDASGGVDELAFEVGEVIEITERLDENWWKGRIGGKEGVFPANYVEPYEEPAEVASPKSTAAAAPPAYSGALNSATPKANKAYKEGQNQWASAKARFSSGGSTAPAAAQTSDQSQAYPPVPTGEPSSGVQQAPMTEAERQRQEKIKKLGGRVGNAAVGGFGFGIGAGLASNLF